MTTHKKKKSTDVKHSIAGFYFQLLIACKELVTLAKFHPAGYVGVEYGADIRVNKGNNKYIEAKFYKADTFSRYSEAVRHTIYNFYNTFIENNQVGDTYSINTNIPVSENDKSFFEDWNKNNFKVPENYINYVKDCLIYEYIDSKLYEEKFNSFKEKYYNENPHLINPQFKSALIKYLHKNPEKYQTYIPKDNLMNNKEIMQFVRCINFDFPTERIEKYDSIISLNEIIDDNLGDLFPGYMPSQYTDIRHIIMNAFLDTTANTSKKVVFVKELKDIVANHEESINTLLENDSLIKTMREIEKELIKYEKKLIRQGFTEQLEHVLKVVGMCTEQWIKEIRLYGEKNINSKYIMGAEHAYTHNILDIFKAMAEVSSSAETDLGDVSLSNLDGVNNIGFSDFRNFSIRTTPSSSDREDEQTLITSFIEHSLKEEEHLRATGDEVIIFENACEICKYNKKKIEEDIVFDIARPFGTIVQQGLYQSFEYKCISCLKLNTTDGECEFANNFKKGKY